MDALEPIYTSQKSFYKKAHVKNKNYETHELSTLYSYETKMAEIATYQDGTKVLIYLNPHPYNYTNTTRIHLNEFFMQNDLEKHRKKDFLDLLDRTLPFALDRSSKNVPFT